MRRQAVIHRKRNRRLSEISKKNQIRVDRIFSHPLRHIECLDPVGHLRVIVIVPENLSAALRHVDGRPGDRLDLSGQPAVIGMTMGDKDVVYILNRPTDFFERTFKGWKGTAHIHTRVEKGNAPFMHKGGDIDRPETKGHGEGYAVQIIGDGID
jgi:hypothetical protein